MGHPLSQTLFTSLYIDRLLWPEPKTLDQAAFDRHCSQPETTNPLVHLVLRAYCLGLIKTCDVVHQIISKESFYEVRSSRATPGLVRDIDVLKEEDFVPNLYNRTLLSKADCEDIHVVLENACTFVENSLNLHEHLQSAIRHRLDFRIAFLSAISSSQKHELNAQHWQRCLEILTSLSLGTKISGDLHPSFSAKIQRRLASSVPPRPIIAISHQSAHDFIERLCEDAMELERATQCTRAGSILVSDLPRWMQPPLLTT